MVRILRDVSLMCDRPAYSVVVLPEPVGPVTRINEGKDAGEISHAARVEGMETLREAAIRKLAEGGTTFEEVVRLTADSL